MSEDDEAERRSVPTHRPARKRTEQGLGAQQVPSPSLGTADTLPPSGKSRKAKTREPSEPAMALPAAGDRVTMEFSGPPLELPADDSSQDIPIPDFGGAEEKERGSEPDAIELVDRNRPSSPDLDLHAEMRERFALHDFTHALRIAELVLGRVSDDADALRIASRSRERLEQIYTARLGAIGRTPELAVPEAEVRWLGLDHRAGFLLSRVDGEHTVEELLDVCGMRRLEGLKTLVELKDVGAIRMK